MSSECMHETIKGNPMSEAYKKLIKTLQTIFEMDKADLDFGIYRIMNQKREEINRFLEHDLLPQVKEAFADYAKGGKSEVQAELDQLIKTLTEAGMDPEQSPKVKNCAKKLRHLSIWWPWKTRSTPICTPSSAAITIRATSSPSAATRTTPTPSPTKGKRSSFTGLTKTSTTSNPPNTCATMRSLSWTSRKTSVSSWWKRIPRRTTSRPKTARSAVLCWMPTIL